MLDLPIIKRESESYITSLGGKVLDTLPTIGLEEISTRDNKAVAQRALVLNVMVNISFNAPLSIANEWLSANDLHAALSEKESSILNGSQPLDEKAKNLLRWDIESLLAAAWVGQLTQYLTPVQPIPDNLATFFPSLKVKFDTDSFYSKFRVRSEEELYPKLDLFYRAHWYARNCHLKGQNSDPFNLGVVQDRRLLLEWVLNRNTEWDNVDLST